MDCTLVFNWIEIGLQISLLLFLTELWSVMIIGFSQNYLLVDGSPIFKAYIDCLSMLCVKLNLKRYPPVFHTWFYQTTVLQNKVLIGTSLPKVCLELPHTIQVSVDIVNEWLVEWQNISWDDFHTFVSGQLKKLYSTWSQFEQVWQCCFRTNLWQSNSFCNFLLGVWQRFRCLHCKNNQLHCKNNQKQCCVSYSWVLVIFLSQWTTHVLCWTYLMIPYKNNPLFSFSLAMIRAVWRNCTWFANSMVVMVFLDRVIQSDPWHY